MLEVLWDYLKWSEVPQGSMHACASAVHSAEITLMLDDVGMEAAEDKELSMDAWILCRPSSMESQNL